MSLSEQVPSEQLPPEPVTPPQHPVVKMCRIGGGFMTDCRNVFRISLFLLAFQVSVIAYCLFPAAKLLAALQPFSFTNAGDYTFDSAVIQVTGGLASLISLDQTYDDGTTSGFG